MIKLSGVIVILIFLGISVARAQTTFLENTPDQSEREEQYELNPDIWLFNTRLDATVDAFTRLSTYNFSPVRYLRRGYDRYFTKYSVDGIDLRDPLTQQIDYSVLSAIERTGSRRTYFHDAASSGICGDLGGLYTMTVKPSLRPVGKRLSMSYSSRRSPLDTKFIGTWHSSDNRIFWSTAASVRGGFDASIDGVSTAEAILNASVEIRSRKGNGTSLYINIPMGTYGLRMSSTKEAFALTGNNLYNPSAGILNDEVRNSRKRTVSRPFFALNHSRKIGESTSLSMTFGWRMGEVGYSGIGWYGASNPYPDYYRYMPSFYSDQVLADRITHYWRENKSSVTGVNWDELYSQNITADYFNEHPAYIVESRIENVNDLQFAANFNTNLNSRIRLSYGFNLRSNTTSNYKKTIDMLNSSKFRDVDQYLIDNQYYSDKIVNDLRNPGRDIYKNDIFGYNYDIVYASANTYGQVMYTDRKFSLSASLEFGLTEYYRDGKYEKEINPGNLSYGRSNKFSYSPYSAKVYGTVNVSLIQYITIKGFYSEYVPAFDDIFHSPQASNRSIPNVEMMNAASGEISYNLLLEKLKVKITGYATLTNKENKIIRYYDDLESEYCDMFMSDISKLYYGTEIGLELPVSNRLRISIAGALGDYSYNNDPNVDIFRDSDAKTILSNDKTYLNGFSVGGTPQTLLTSELYYSGNKGWAFSISGTFMGNHYESVSPLRRMQRVTASATSPEAFDEMTGQQRLNDAFMVDLTIFKSMKVGNSSRINIVGSVKNLLNNRSVIYSGYEQMRVRKNGSGIDRTFSPFPSKYLYSYGIGAFLSVNYSF